MSQPEISIDVARDGGPSRVFINGVLCRAVTAVVAYPGAGIMLMLDPDDVRVKYMAPAGAGAQDLAPGPLATDGQA